MADVDLTLQPKSQQISHRWRTAIQTAKKGPEQRSALYSWPRLILRYTYDLVGSREINWVKRKLIRETDAIWGIPVWPDATTLSSQAASGQKVLAVAETAYRHFYEDRRCIVISAADRLSYEVGTIDVLAAQQITLAANLGAAWPAGSWVLPYYDCRINPGEQAIGSSARRQTFSIEATEEYETARTFAYSLPASGAPTYEGFDLFLQTAGRPIEYGYNRPYDLLQFLGLGYAASGFAAGENALGLKTALTRPTRQAIRETLSFFDACQGRLQAFWVPSWNRDLVATAAVLAGDTVLTVENVEYETHYLTNEVVGRYVYIRFPDGAYVCRQIVAADDDTPSITLDSAIGTAVAAGALRGLLISFLILCRFDIDELIMDYPKGLADFARCEISVRGLVGEAPV